MLETLPSVYSTTGSSISKSTSDYGILQTLDGVLQDKESKFNSVEIKNETEKRLEQMELVEYDKALDDPEYELKTVPAIDPRDFEPIVFDELKNESILVNNTSILDFLLNQPLNYLIFTKHNNTITWTNALLRRSLVFPKFNPWRWEYIDIDNNLSNGDELRVRFDIVINDWDFNRPTLLPPSSGSIKLKGGFGLTIERTTNRNFPLELYIAKSISYEGENYIWSTGVFFDNTPAEYSSVLLAETIELDGLSQNLINALLIGGIGNLVNTTLAEINGPYSLRYGYDTDTHVEIFDLMAGIVRYENQSFSNKNWLVFHLTPAINKNHHNLPTSGEVWVDSSNVQAPLDKLRWTAGIEDQASQNKIPINLNIRYGEERENYIFADVELIDLPERFTINIDYTKVINSNNITVLDYSASDILSVLNYTSYFYEDYSNQSSMNDFKYMHVRLESVPTRLHIEMTSDIGRDINTTPYRNPKSGIAANIIDNLISRFANRFYRIGKYLKLVAEGILELPSKKGWATINTYGEQISSIEFSQTDGLFLDRPGNFIGFFNTSQPSLASGSPPDNSTINDINGSISDLPEQSNFAISGRITGLKWINLSFSTPLELEMRALNGDPFIGLLIDGKNYASGHISNMPEYIKIMNLNNNSFYSTIDPEAENGAEGIIIDRFSFISRFEKQLMQLDISGIPGSLEFNQKDDVITFSTIDDEYIEEFSYMVVSDINKAAYQIESGNFISILQDEEYVTSNGRLAGIRSLTYDKSDDGYFELSLNQEKPFQIVITDFKTNNTKAKLILDPLPSDFRLELPGTIKQTNIEFPDMTNITGFLDYSTVVFTLGKLGQDVINLLSNLSQNLIESIGNIGFNFSISYELESFGKSLDIIAEIDRGSPAQDVDLASAPEIGWTHGICMSQELLAGTERLRGHLYLQGLPRAASLKTSFTDNTTDVDFNFIDYNPRYEWLLIDLKGIQNRDVNVFFQHIPSNVDFQASIALVTNLNIGGEMRGRVDMSVKDAGSNKLTKELGALYVNMHTYKPIQSIREFFISELPGQLDINFTIQKEINLLYEASKEIEFIYSKLSKILTDSWHHVNLILHDLPKSFKFNLFSNTDFDMDKPLPLQGMPTLDMNTKNTNQLDILISLDGAAVGQRGSIDIFMQDISDTTGKFEGDSYKINSNGLDYLRLKITDLPLLDNYKLNSLVLEAEELSSLKFKVNLLFGVFPYFDLGSNSKGKVEVNIDHTLKLFGQNRRIQVALIDVVYESVGGAKLPVGTPIFVNSINSELTKTRDHVIIPAPLISLVITWINEI